MYVYMPSCQERKILGPIEQSEKYSTEIENVSLDFR